MPKMRLTDSAIRKMKPPPDGKQVMIFDEAGKGDAKGGLMLRLSQGGSKTFSVLYYKGKGKPAYFPIGRFPAVSLKQAREQTRLFLADPASALAAAEKKAATGTFEAVSKDFIKRYVQKNNLRSHKEIERQFRVYCYPQWKDTPFIDIKRGDVTRLLDKVEDENGAVMADRLLASIRKLMNWYATRDEDYVSPIIKGMARTKPKERERKRRLSDEEIRNVWAACAGMGVFGSMLQLALLTAQRIGKIKTMQHEDVKDGIWTIPAEAREKSTGSQLKLPQAALDIIERQPRILDNPYVFPAAFGEGHFNSFSQRFAELLEKLPEDMPQWRIHDLRRTARQLMSRAGIRPDVAELVLGHSIKGIQGTYDNREAYQAMIDEALAALEIQVKLILDPPKKNVITLQLHSTP